MAAVFLCRQGLCNCVAPRIAWRTLAHQADVRLMQVNLLGSLLRKPLAPYESLRTHQKKWQQWLLLFYMRTKVSRHIAPKKAAAMAAVFFMSSGTLQLCCTTYCVANNGTIG